MTVTKVVVLVLRIPEQSSLYFSDFATIFYGIYKFAAFDSSVHVRFSLRPLDFCFFSGEVPGGTEQNRGDLARWFPAMRVTGGRGKWGKMERGLSATFRWSWLVGRGSELGCPR